MENNIAISIKNVSKTFFVKDRKVDTIKERVTRIFTSNQSREITALKTLNLEIKKGEIFGIIGRNGSGKSTLLNLIMGSIQPNKGGQIETDGRIIRLALSMGFDMNLTALENIFINGSVLGVPKRHMEARIGEIIKFSELEGYLNTKIKFFSNGMKARLSFAIALYAKADIFLFDEFFGGVGDIVFKKKSDDVFKSTMLQNKTIILTTHNFGVIKQHSNRVLLLDKGTPVLIGSPEEAINKYREIANVGKSSFDK